MRIVLTNDDGFDAPGIAALEEASRDLGEIIVVAPEAGHSGCGHRVTTDRPLAVRKLGSQRFAVDGTPADCTRVALTELARDASIVLAGINAGGNMGIDVYMSGTVAAAREAVFLGVPAIALSQYHGGESGIDWTRSADWARAAIEALLAEDAVTSSPARLSSVNFPNLPAGATRPEIVRCALDINPMRVSYRAVEIKDQDGQQSYRYEGDYHKRPRAPDTDVERCMGGRITITELNLLG